MFAEIKHEIVKLNELATYGLPPGYKSPEEPTNANESKADN
jgi:hypothetical protein